MCVCVCVQLQQKHGFNKYSRLFKRCPRCCQDKPPQPGWACELRTRAPPTASCQERRPPCLVPRGAQKTPFRLLSVASTSPREQVISSVDSICSTEEKNAFWSPSRFPQGERPGRRLHLVAACRSTACLLRVNGRAGSNTPSWQGQRHRARWKNSSGQG